MSFDINNEINFYKRKILAPRVEQSQTLIPFSVQIRSVCSELLSKFTNVRYTFSYLENSPTPQWAWTPGQEICVGALTRYTSVDPNWGVRFVAYKCKVFYCQELPSEKFTTTECGVNYQLLAVIYWNSTMGNSYSYSRPQLAADNGVRDGRSNWQVAPPDSWAVPPERLVHNINQCSLSRESTLQP